MPYIYKITNKINNKVYIGKTLDTVEKRWKEHCRDSQKKNIRNRPLYSAMNKYGFNNFIIEEIEQCNEEALNEREQYWIEYFGSFKYGYNATLGGDGKRYADYDLIYALWNEGKTIKKIAEITKYDEHTIRVALNCQNISSEERKKRAKLSIGQPVAQLDKITNEIIAIYSSREDACRAIGKQTNGHIAEVCSGKRKTAYGYKWKNISI